jgi:hypothetical protein
VPLCAESTKAYPPSQSDQQCHSIKKGMITAPCFLPATVQQNNPCLLAQQLINWLTRAPTLLLHA